MKENDFYSACYRGDINVVKRFCNENCTNLSAIEKGCSYAIYGVQPDILFILLQHPEFEVNQTLLSVAIHTNEPTLVSKIIDSRTINVNVNHLRHAIMRRNIDIVRILIEAGELNINKHIKSLLLLALDLDLKEIVHLLVAYSQSKL